ncbi:copper chaperone CopZ [Sporosarcina sp. HYO08]|uniref:copper chaperone CopZ n=1 Tax=Sporosarcina sp. HYO08 TaxID=1759557 RepID=UPI0007944937|nr:copper chaperone CopZ [Sporosarcina sp. HYO08]KXH83750.1 copper resistance protein CopZ [Sporosarcina sp. HYO08]
MKEIIKVEGMSCGHCVNAIETSVGGLTGVAAVAVDLNKAEVAVEFDATQTTVADIKETIEDQGFDVKA